MRKRHIPDLIKTIHFRSTKFTRNGENHYRIQYEVKDLKSLDEYLKTQYGKGFAPILTLSFPEGIEVFR